MKSHTVSSNSQRGFTMIVVIMIVAILAVMGVALLNLLNLDNNLVGQSRRGLHARDIAMGGTVEVINMSNLTNVLPKVTDPNLSVLIQANEASAFSVSDNADDYQARVSFMRVVPLTESSQGLSRAVVYEIVTRSRYENGEATSEVRTEIYRPASWEGQSIQPKRHYR